ncbi:FixH family protein [Cytobacillus purgationiresistens]|uniref:YtkA-like domain-containing protein n=1 Tax=Cytobacillus purgationiresistens TaxID=863449 RepID=A0ABU0AGU8_9BACI|nr:FixH family protein [Cytobacillus purgationiresistens]MDQ0270479.1 hypothetical protein [Cytobacillus purgationiresistens]
MKKLQKTIILLFVLFLISGCATNLKEKDQDQLDRIDAEIMVPEKIQLNEQVSLAAEVKQGDEVVEEVDEFQFEIQRVGGEGDNELINVSQADNGIYQIKKVFSEAGVYTVQTHVTAMGQHVMPKKRFVVGNLTEEEINEFLEKSQTEEDTSGGNHQHH